ncbi:hypothetical protein pipiens_017841 [Culex pipiens pipiens]|uniref:OTU domain-containing protein n=1 Tax=Culex pipiens pipiens TaxID=38569 RepID=A0ABD1CEQ5_CULPP
MVLTEIVHVAEGMLTVVTIPGDGACLFSALAHQMWGFSLTSAEHLSGTRQLRADVVNFYRQDLPRWLEGLYAQACTIFPSLVYRMSVGQLVEHFMTQLANDSFWGGEESIVALSRHYDRSILVYREGAQHSAHNVNGSEPLRIVHRRSAVDPGEYVHYDSVLSLQLSGFSRRRLGHHSSAVPPSHASGPLPGSSSQVSFNCPPLHRCHLECFWLLTRKPS